MKAAVFLDRDGVINAAAVRDGRPYSPATLADFTLLPGVPDALRDLARHDFLLVVVTNQPDVGAGRQSREVVEAMHRRLMRELPLNAIHTCYHVDADGCECRKPRPGLLKRAAAEAAIDLRRSYMIGDRWRDVGAGRHAGCFTIFIDRGYAEPLTVEPDITCRDLPEAVSWILARSASTVEARRRD